MLHKDLRGIFPGNPKHLQSVGISYKKKVDEALIAKIDSFILRSLEDFFLIGLNKIVVGISGGSDSVVTAALLKRTIGDAASAVIIDFEIPDDNSILAVESAEKVGIKYIVIKGADLLEKQLNIFENNSALTKIHLRSRLVNNIIFQHADNIGAAVAETTDKSENLLSIYAESFRGHLALLSDFYKSEVYDIADYLSLPELRERKSGCPNLIDIDAFGVDWDILDPVLYLLKEKNIPISELAATYNLDLEWLRSLECRISRQPIRTGTKRL